MTSTRQSSKQTNKPQNMKMTSKKGGVRSRGSAEITWGGAWSVDGGIEVRRSKKRSEEVVEEKRKKERKRKERKKRKRKKRK